MKNIKHLLILLGGLFSTSLYAQTDTEFWFVIPDIQDQFDNTMRFVVSSSNQAATVTFSQPANPAFPTQTLTLSTNDVQVLPLNVSPYQNAKTDIITDLGFLITSTAPVTVYFENANNLDPDIFTLKGRNALGTEFFATFQDTLGNNSGYNPDPTSSIDVVATEDNTTITIVPTQSVSLASGTSPANTPITRTLNRGQAYSVIAAGLLGSNHLGGTKITSDKPIAVTLIDDAVQFGGSDLIGDQTVPVSQLGREYVVQTGKLSREFIYVLATENSTDVFIDGQPTAIQLNEGQFHRIERTTSAINSPSVYINATKPVYVFHISGLLFGSVNNEVAGAIIPPVDCGGLNQVGFNRSTSDDFYLMLTVPAGGEGSFSINVQNGTATISASDFTDVPGTNQQWKSAIIPYSNAVFPSGNAAIVSNSTHPFSLGFLNRGISSSNNGARYGYFSEFSNLGVDIGLSDTTICSGNNIQFNVTGGGPSGVYTWTPATGLNQANISNPVASPLSTTTYGVLVSSSNGCTDQAFVTVTVDDSCSCPYAIGADTIVCGDLDCPTIANPTICVPFLATQTVQDSMIGIDFCMTYDPTVLSPTGGVEIGDVVLHSGTQPSWGNYAINHTQTPGQLHVSIWYNGSAPAGTYFQNQGEIACVEFQLQTGFQAGLETTIGSCEVMESFPLYTELECADSAVWRFENDSVAEGTVIFWNDEARPLRYDDQNLSAYLATNIIGTDASCLPTTGAPTSQPDLDGHFDYHLSNGPSIQLTRDIDNNTSVMSVINGQDAYFMSLITTLNPSFLPSDFQMLAADLNMDDVVSAGDITHLMDRVILNIGQFPQAWNPTPTANNPTLDWRFVDEHTRMNNDFVVSSNYPQSDGSGYTRYDVPDVPFCLPLQTSSTAFCNIYDSTLYHSVLLGDITGGWSDVVATALKSAATTSDTVVFDLCNAIAQGPLTYRIPIYAKSTQSMTAMDFDMDYDQTKLNMSGVHNLYPNLMDMAYNVYQADRLLMTSYSLQLGGINRQPVYELVVHMAQANTRPTEADLGMITAFFNGQKAAVKVIGHAPGCASITSLAPTLTELVSVYPQPMKDYLIIEHPAQIDLIQLIDLQGKVLTSHVVGTGQQTKLDMSALPNGIFVLMIDGQVIQKVVK